MHGALCDSNRGLAGLEPDELAVRVNSRWLALALAVFQEVTGRALPNLRPTPRRVCRRIRALLSHFGSTPDIAIGGACLCAFSPFLGNPYFC